MTVDWHAVSPEDTIAFLRGKGFAVDFNWRDVWQEEHRVAFTVAKAMSLDVLETIRDAVDRALAEGVTFAEFKGRLEPLLRAAGWWGRRTMTDPLTGEQVQAQLGSDRRLKIIFNTNLRMAYAAGQWRRIERRKEARPYLIYDAIMDSRVRPEHAAWNGIVLPVDDAFWRTHMPPNGWNCRCTVRQLAPRDLERDGLRVSDPPSIEWEAWVDNRHGRVIPVPKGIDPGFAANPGRVDRLAEAEARLKERQQWADQR